jgi:hypothetical protein
MRLSASYGEERGGRGEEGRGGEGRGGGAACNLKVILVSTGALVHDLNCRFVSCSKKLSSNVAIDSA